MFCLFILYHRLLRQKITLFENAIGKLSESDLMMHVIIFKI